MAALTPQRLQKLRALLQSLPGSVCDRLLGQAQIADPALGRLLGFCVADPEAAARDRFMAPLAPFSHDPATTRPSLCWTPAPVLDGIWRWIAEELAPEVADATREIVTDFDAPVDQGALDPHREAVGEAALAALDALADNPRAHKQLCARLGVDDLERVRDAAALLRASAVLRRGLEDLEPSLTTVDDAMSALLRDRYEHVIEADSDAGSWFLYLVMARLDKPWLILRVFQRIAGRDDDFLVSRTEMHLIGDALLRDAEHQLALLAETPADLIAADGAAAALAEFAAVTVGMTREIGIRRDGDWGKHLVKLRTRAAALMEAHHAAASRTLDGLLLDPRRIKAGRWTDMPTEDGPEFRKAEAACRFLQLTRADASRAAVGGSHQSVVSEIDERLHEQGGAVLERLRLDENADHEVAERHLQLVARLFEALDETEAAAVLLRRGAAAKAA